MNRLIWKTAEEMDLDIAIRIKKIRKRKRISQMQLAELSNVSLGSIKRFENSGQISLISLTKIAIALDSQDNILDLFQEVPYKNIEEVIYDSNK